MDLTPYPDAKSLLPVPTDSVQHAVHTTLSLLRPVAPQLVPLAICLGVIPWLLFFSLSVGWLIWRSVPTGWQVPVSLHYGDGALPYAELSLPKLVAKLPYDVSLQLTVPATEANYALGNFMTSLTLFAANNKTLVQVRRSSLILPPPPFLFGFSRAQRLMNINVPLLAHFVPSTTSALARIELGRKDSWKSLGNGEGRELSVFSAFVRGEIHPQGLLGILARLPLTVSIISSAVFFFVSLLVVLACMLPIVRWRPARISTSSRAEQMQRRPSLDPQATVRRPSDAPLMDAPLIESTQGTELQSLSPEPELSAVALRLRLRRLTDSSSDSDN